MSRDSCKLKDVCLAGEKEGGKKKKQQKKKQRRENKRKRCIHEPSAPVLSIVSVFLSQDGIGRAV